MVKPDECLAEGAKVLSALIQAVESKHMSFPPGGLKGLKGLVLIHSKKGALGVGYETGSGVAINVGYNDDGSIYTSGPVPLKLSKLTVGVQLGFNNVFTMMAVYHYSQMEKLLSSAGAIVGKDINVAGLPYQHDNNIQNSKQITSITPLSGNADATQQDIKVITVSDSYMVCDFSLYGGSLGVDKALLDEMYGGGVEAKDVLGGKVPTPEAFKGAVDAISSTFTKLANM
ncbi:hypothetical protein HYH03_010129 [Edaphochlamys debaryana]|uniref:Ysc84 actin-binding domain-containing protein n=1 Tax=Edaphochlamys debaryana TaxID=47281 RepID=A0A836BWJ5_9CHLO|nr:hypothetical protein HYH03_010129 [Edaphochlamys debaryana]|eukprot:KAG2491560.1 hypothetical protein HYH03_010129 [Edaphochlamys debaryana]